MAQQSMFKFAVIAVSVALIANPAVLYFIYRIITVITKTKKRYHVFLSLLINLMLMVISLYLFVITQPVGVLGFMSITIVYGFFTIYTIIPIYFIMWKYKPR